MSKKNPLGIFLISISIISLILAFECYTMPTGTVEEYIQYGGDAYTGIQHASAKTANNIVILIKNINNIAGHFFLLVAALLGSVGTIVQKNSSQNTKSHSTKGNDENSPKRIPTLSSTHFNSPREYKCCPDCGEVITSSTCSFCGQKNDFFDSTPQKIPPLPSTLSDSSRKYKCCPHCGEAITSSTCSLCGKKNNLFE